MKKFTFMMALFVCAIGFSQTTSFSDWAEQNPQARQQNVIETSHVKAADVTTTASNFGVNNPLVVNADKIVTESNRSTQADCSASNPSNAFENGRGNNAGNGWTVANDIIVPMGSDMMLSQVTTFEFMTAGGATVVSADITIYDDNAGVPGVNVIATENVVPTSNTVVGSNFGFDISEVVFDITPVALAGDAAMDMTYWVAVQVTTSDGGSAFWEDSAASAIGNPLAFSDDGGATWSIPDAARDGVYVFTADCTPIGGGGSGCTAGVYTDRASFDAEAGALPLEDFTGGPSSLTSCDDVLSDAGDTCFPAGELLPGFEITTNTPGNGTIYIDPSDGFGNTIPIVGTNTFTDVTIINFPNNDVNAFGFDLYSLLNGSNMDIRIYGMGGLIDTQVVDVTSTGPVFFGYIANETIVSVELEDLSGTDVEVLGMLAFGGCSSGGGTTCDTNVTYDSTAVPFEIDGPDTSTADCAAAPNLIPTSVVDESGIIGTDAEVVGVTIDIAHTWSGDLTISLRAPTGEEIILADGLSGNTDDAYNGTMFMDGGADITVATAPFGVGPYAAQGGDMNAAFAGVEINGDWNLVVCDNAGGDTGFVNQFSLELCSTAPVAPTCVVMEDFEAGLPAGWSTVVNTGTCDWINSDQIPTGGPTLPSLAMVFDDDACGNGADASNVTLMSDVYYTGNATFITLTYDVGFQVAGTQFLYVEVWDGAAWQQVAMYDADLPADIQTETIDVTAYANADFQVRWTYDDNGGEWGWYAAVDNFCLDHDAVLGVADNVIEGFSYYPNPANNVINLSAQDNIENVAIYNILGQKVVDQNINATSSQINVSGLSTGTYIMKATVNGTTASYKVIKN